MLKLLISMAISCFMLQSTASATTDFYEGIDVSFYQGEINFEELSDSNHKYLYIRAGEGGNAVDSRFSENVKGAESEQLNYGCYYYVTAKNVSEAESQAEHFASLISGLSYSLRPAMDFEDLSGLSVEETNEIALSFLKKLEELTGVTPAIYSDAYAVETRWSSELAPYPLWVADYAHLPEPEQYTLPKNDVWTVWSGYQYSDSGMISGIDGNVDLDLFTSGLIIDKTSENTSPEIPITSSSYLLSYTVEQGDTLWQISKRFQSTVATLVTENMISNRDLIYVGEVLEIPMKESYSVKSGDTLTEIALKFETTVDILAEINQIKDINLITVGEILYIP